MSLDAGRAKLYTAWKTLQQRWYWTERYWHDAAHKEFAEKHWQPLEPQVVRMLAAIDRLSQVMSRVRQECE